MANMLQLAHRHILTGSQWLLELVQ